MHLFHGLPDRMYGILCSLASIHASGGFRGASNLAGGNTATDASDDACMLRAFRAKRSASHVAAITERSKNNRAVPIHSQQTYNVFLPWIFTEHVRKRSPTRA